MASYGKNREGRRRQPAPSSSSICDENLDKPYTFTGDNSVMLMFKDLSRSLNDRYDRHERLVKISRDITIESKRIIFLLHSATNKEDAVKAVTEAKTRLNKLVQGQFKAIGLELENSPAYLHSRAVSPGFQEFIEAKLLCQIVENRQLVDYETVEKELIYEVKVNEEGETKIVKTMLPSLDYMLGMADLTGELMRRTINSIASGDNDEGHFSCQLVRDLYTGFIGVYEGGRALNAKLSTTRSNLQKVESAVYALHVRGGEHPPSFFIPQFSAGPEPQQDEGYFN